MVRVVFWCWCGCFTFSTIRNCKTDDYIDEDIDKEFKCGCCHTSFIPPSNKSHHLERKCLTCYKIFPIFQDCAGRMLQYQVQQDHCYQGSTENVLRMNQRQFDTSKKIIFHCKDCQQDSCFSCGIHHRSGYIKAVQCSKCKLKWSYAIYDHGQKKGCYSKAITIDQAHQTLCNECTPEPLRRSTRSKNINSIPTQKKKKKKKKQNEKKSTSNSPVVEVLTSQEINNDVVEATIVDQSNLSDEEHTPIIFEHVSREKFIDKKNDYSDHVLKFQSTSIEAKVLKQFEHSFGLGGLDYDECFNSMDQAKSHFSKKYTYLIKPKNPSLAKTINVFEPNLPKYLIKAYQIKDNEIPTVPGSLCIQKNSIKTLYECQWLNDEVMEVMLRILALYYEKEKTQGNALNNNLVGSVFSNEYVIPNPNNFGLLHDFLENPTIEKQNQFIRSMVEWYTIEKKGLLKRQLDRLTTIGVTMGHYYSALNIHNYHWVALKISLLDSSIGKKKNKYGVQIIDPLSSSKDNVVEPMTWFAKYFRLYEKESSNISFTKSDFDGKDMIRTRTDKSQLTFDDTESEDDSDIENENKRTILPLLVTQNKYTQEDGYNCGVIAILQTFDNVLNSKKIPILHQLKNDKNNDISDKDELLKWRLRMLSFIDKVQDIIYGELYDKCRKHLYMDDSNQDKRYKKRFKVVHKMFREGIFSIQQSDPNDDDFECNANTICQKYTIGDLHDITEKKGKKQLSQDIIAIVDEHESKSESDIEYDSDYQMDIVKPPKQKVKVNTKKRKKITQPPKRKSRRISKKGNLGFGKKIQKIGTCYLIDEPHSRTEHYKNLNLQNIHVGIVPSEEKELGIENSDDESDQMLWKPEKLVRNLLTFFISNYCEKKTDKDSITNLKKFKAYITLMMEKYNTYFIMDYSPRNNDENQYHITTAMIVENLVYCANKTEAVIIHAIGMDLSHVPYKDNLKTMFHYICKESPDTLSRSCYVVTNPGKMNCVQHVDDASTTIQKELSDLGFKRPLSRIFIEEFVENDSKLLQQFGSNLFNSQSIYNSDTERRLIINNRHKVQFMYKDNTDKFMVKSHHFGWNIATPEEVQFFSVYRNGVKENPNKPFTFGGLGARSPNNFNDMSKHNTSIKIEEEFRQHHYQTRNNCVWLSVALLLHYYDGETGKKMLHLMRKDPNNYEWLTLMKPKKRTDMASLGHNRDDNLHKLLQKHTTYNLCKMKKKMGSNHCCIDYLLKDDTKGMYVCVLDDNNGDALHTITIDCNKKVVYDCLNDYVMKLETEALEFCVGPLGGGLDSISTCYEVSPKHFTTSHIMKTL